MTHISRWSAGSKGRLSWTWSRSNRGRSRAGCAAALALSLVMASACTPSSNSSAPTAGDEDLQVRPAALSVATSAVKANVSRPLRELRPAPGIIGGGDNKTIPIGIPHPSSTTRARGAAVADPVRQAAMPAVGPLAPTPGTTFEGVGQGFVGPNGTFQVGVAPPDTNGAIGPNHFVQLVNIALAVFNRTGEPVLGPIPINELWRDFGGLCENFNSGDPTVNYDRFRRPLGDRAVRARLRDARFRPVRGGVDHGRSDGTYARYAFPHDIFPDYPKIGVWPDAYYITFNMFNASGSGFVGPRICAVDRPKMLAGQPATQRASTRARHFRASCRPI